MEDTVLTVKIYLNECLHKKKRGIMLTQSPYDIQLLACRNAGHARRKSPFQIDGNMQTSRCLKTKQVSLYHFI